MMVDSELSLQAIEHFGLPNQILKCIEELHELTEVLLKTLKPLNNIERMRLAEITRRTRANLDSVRIGLKVQENDIDEETRLDLMLELADVIVTVNQVNLFYGWWNELQTCIQSKEDRLRERMA